MMQIRCLPSCQNFEPPNVPRKQNPRRLFTRTFSRKINRQAAKVAKGEEAIIGRWGIE